MLTISKEILFVGLKLLKGFDTWEDRWNGARKWTVNFSEDYKTSHWGFFVISLFGREILQTDEFFSSINCENRIQSLLKIGMAETQGR